MRLRRFSVGVCLWQTWTLGTRIGLGHSWRWSCGSLSSGRRRTMSLGSGIAVASVCALIGFMAWQGSVLLIILAPVILLAGVMLLLLLLS